MKDDKHKISRFYHCVAWRNLRQHILNEYVLCYYCNLIPSDSVHHIKPLHTSDGWQHRLSAFVNGEPNLVGVDVQCHQRLTKDEQKQLNRLKQDVRHDELSDFD